LSGIPDRVLKIYQRSVIQALISIAFASWGFCALLCLVMALGARTQAIPAFINGLGLCDGKPCYLNIQPSQTSWDEAQNHLESFAEVQKFGASGYDHLPGFQGTLLLIPNQDNMTQEIVLSPADNPIFVGGAVLQLGAPCAAVRLGRDDVVLIYPGIAIISRMKKVGNYFVLRPTSSVRGTNLSSQVEACSDIGLDRTQADFRWHGFARYAENSG
jgi:hypothetical protein